MANIARTTIVNRKTQEHSLFTQKTKNLHKINQIIILIHHRLFSLSSLSFLLFFWHPKYHQSCFFLLRLLIPISSNSLPFVLHFPPFLFLIFNFLSFALFIPNQQQKTSLKFTISLSFFLFCIFFLIFEVEGEKEKGENVEEESQWKHYDAQGLPWRFYTL